MLIVSNSKDYYDYIAKFGVDNKIVYYRKLSTTFGEPIDNLDLENEKNELQKNFPYWTVYNILKNHIDYSYLILGVCGTVYGVVYNNKEKKAYYSISELPPLLEKKVNFKPKYFDLNRTNTLNKRYNYLAPFLKLNAPVWCFYLKHFYVTPRLKDLEFYKIKSAQDIFQNIAFFISNELTEKDSMKMLEVDDKYRIEQHGFNKLSFRHPTR